MAKRRASRENVIDLTSKKKNKKSASCGCELDCAVSPAELRKDTKLLIGAGYTCECGVSYVIVDGGNQFDCPSCNKRSCIACGKMTNDLKHWFDREKDVRREVWDCQVCGTENKFSDNNTAHTQKCSVCTYLACRSCLVDGDDHSHADGWVCTLNTTPEENAERMEVHNERNVVKHFVRQFMAKGTIALMYDRLAHEQFALEANGGQPLPLVPERVRRMEINPMVDLVTSNLVNHRVGQVYVKYE
jgi:hypothetical protein